MYWKWIGADVAKLKRRVALIAESKYSLNVSNVNEWEKRTKWWNSKSRNDNLSNKCSIRDKNFSELPYEHSTHYQHWCFDLYDLKFTYSNQNSFLNHQKQIT